MQAGEGGKGRGEGRGWAAGWAGRWGWQGLQKAALKWALKLVPNFLLLFREICRNYCFLFQFLPPTLHVFSLCVSPPARSSAPESFALTTFFHSSVRSLKLPCYPQSLCASSPATAVYDASLRKLLPPATER